MLYVGIHAKSDNVSKEQYNAIEALSVINNCVYILYIVKQITVQFISEVSHETSVFLLILYIKILDN